jgi:hypothetical protein
MGEVTLAGLTLTQEEWEGLDEESRALIREALTPAGFEHPYADYVVTWDDYFPAHVE